MGVPAGYFRVGQVRRPASVSFRWTSRMPYLPVAYSSNAILTKGARSSSTTIDRTVRPSNSSTW